jgi:hypothetical protein|tara:strand:- start:109 stop:306 length:198 start_codon:yes stop_codon:yes gene_type:complete
MQKLFLIISAGLMLTACNTTYVTDEGKRLIGNSALGCVAGEVLFGECAKGAAVGAGATVISDQKK